VLRVKGEALLYYETDQQRHEVLIPWGRGEEIIVVVTNRDEKGSFAVDLLGPPRDQVHAAYSYHVNRALEAYGSGQRLKAEAECQAAISADDTDDVAKVLLAGFYRNRGYYSRAESLVDEALKGELPEEMQSLARDLKTELAKLRAPLPAEVVQGVERIENLLADGKGESALAVCDDLLSGDLVLDSPSKSRLQMLRGQALDQLDRNFESVDAFTKALQFARDRDGEAVIYFHMGRLYLKMENLQQAQGAYTMALNYGLPSGLDVQAREDLKKIEKRLAQ
jgi:tetratricopeptide (TPR) repeat protein